MARRESDMIRMRQTRAMPWLTPVWSISLGLIGLAALLSCVLLFPRWLYPSLTSSELDAQQLRGKERVDAINDRLNLQNEARTTLLQGFAGTVLLLGAYLTWRQLQHSIESGREQRELDRQGQITERYTRAVDQLGSVSLDVRLGGLYGLESVAHESEQYRGPITEILAAYVRVHAALPSDDEQFPQPDSTLPWLRNRAADTQAALTVFGRSPRVYGTIRPDLSRVDLRRCYLREATLIHIRCRRATLAGSWLDEANLSKSDLTGTDFRHASFVKANLHSATLREADLRHANLTNADLTNADLQDAVANMATRWPYQFDYRQAGVHLVQWRRLEFPASRRRRVAHLRLLRLARLRRECQLRRKAPGPAKR
jgi:hypothetical protein